MKRIVCNKQCPYSGAPYSGTKPCVDCITEEINHYREKIKALEEYIVKMQQSNDKKEGAIEITLDELIEAQAKAIDIMRLTNPAILLLNDELTTLSAIICALLFKEEK